MKLFWFVFMFFPILSINTFAMDLGPFCKSASAMQHKYLKRNKVTTPRLKKNGFSSRPKEYLGCKMKDNWIESLLETVCDGKNPKYFDRKDLNAIQLPKVLMVYIAGAGDFNARKIKRSVAPVNIDGTEGNDLQGMNVSGRFLVEVYKLLESVGMTPKEDIELHYYAGSGFKSEEGGKFAKACLKQSYEYVKILNELKGNDLESPKFVLMGYSNGGELSINFQEDLGDEISLDLVLAIDPIVQTIKYPFTINKGFLGEKHPKTKRLVSLYQRDDYGSMPGFKLRGRPVENADLNYQISSDNSRGMSHTGHRNHMNILKSNIVQETVAHELELILE